MIFQESETIELKEIVEDIKKEIIAFANSAGGTLYIGVANDGHVVGVHNADQVMQQIVNMVHDSIKPDITMFLHYEAVTVDEKSVVAVEIQRGTQRPYYLAKKGLRPEGVYVRQGTSTIPASDTAIRRMIKETDGDNYEERRSLQQHLTFEAAAKEFAERNTAFGIPQMKTLGILNTDGLYTNLGLLLSDECSHTIKAATFAGTDQSVFRDRREFSGSLLRQLNEVYDYIDLRNQTLATFDKLRRIDKRDYPETAVREALLNALVHRDYSYSASTLISIYADRMEFTTIGGLPAGLTLADIMLGLSVCRNPKLANVFYRLELIEAYGTGIQKILNAYAGSGKTPLIEATDNAFKLVLPNRNANAPAPLAPPAENDAKQAVLETVRRQGSVTRKDVEALAGISQTAAVRLLNDMVNRKLLVRVGQGKNIKYTATS